MNSFGKGFALVAGLSIALLQGQALGQASKLPLQGAALRSRSGSARCAQPRAGRLRPRKAASRRRVHLGASQCGVQHVPTNGPTMLGESSKRPKAQFHSAPPPQDLKKRDQQTKPNNPAERQMNAAARQRKNRLQARVRATARHRDPGPREPLRVHAQERRPIGRSSAAVSPKATSSSSRPRSATRPKRRSRPTKPKKNERAGRRARLRRRRPARPSRSWSPRARRRSSTTRSIKNEYPNYAQIDEVLYYLAYEYEQAQRLRQRAQGLLRAHPEGAAVEVHPQRVPRLRRALLQRSAGRSVEVGSRRAGATRKSSSTRRRRTRSTATPATSSATSTGTRASSARRSNEFKKTIEYGDAVRDAARTPRSSRRRGAPRHHPGLRARRRVPTRAYNFFKPLSGDAGGENEKTFKMMDDLGHELPRHRSLPRSHRLYHDLMGRDRGDKLLRLPGHITEATHGHEVRQQGASSRPSSTASSRSTTSSPRPSTPTKRKLECANRTAELLAETAMAGTSRPSARAACAAPATRRRWRSPRYLYKKVVDNFTPDEFAKFEFPRIVKEDWPTIYKIKYAMADLLYFQQRLGEVRPRLRLRRRREPERRPRRPRPRTPRCSATRTSTTETHKDERRPKGARQPARRDEKERQGEARATRPRSSSPRSFTDNQKGMITAFNRYICYIKPTEGDKQADEQYVEVKYARARTYFEAQHWEEAALGVPRHRDQPRRQGRRHLRRAALPRVAQRARHAQRAAQAGLLRDMAQDVPHVHRALLQGPNVQKNQRAVHVAQQDPVRHPPPEGGEDGRARRHAAARKRLAALREGRRRVHRDLANVRRRAACKAKQPVHCEKLDEVALQRREGLPGGAPPREGDPGRRLILINPSTTWTRPTLAKKAVYEIGGNYQAIAVYDEAANWYEKYAEGRTRRARTPTRRSPTPTVLRLGLGQEEQAIKDADALQQELRRHEAGADRAAIALRHRRPLRRAGGLGQGAKRAHRRDGAHRQDATLDVQVQAHALLAAPTPSSKRAKDAQGRVRQGPQALERRQGRRRQDHGAPRRGRGRARSAASARRSPPSARRSSSSPRRSAKTSRRSSSPSTRARATRKTCSSTSRTKVKDWIKKKRPAIEDGAGRVHEDRRAPAGAAAAVGHRRRLARRQMWGNFVARVPRGADPERDEEGHRAPQRLLRRVSTRRREPEQAARPRAPSRRASTTR